MSKLDLNPNDFKHVKSDEKSTTLQHKNGHMLTIAHNVISDNDKTVLQSLANSKPNPNPNGKVIRKFDEGGRVPAPSTQTDSSDRQNNLAQASQVERTGSDQSQAATASSPSTMWNNVKNAWADGGRVKMAEGGTAAYDAGLPCLNPHCKSHGKPHPNCRCYGMAEGGEALPLRYCAHGKPHMSECEYSEQGKDIRHAMKQSDPDQQAMHKGFAKDEAKGRAAMERTVKPKMQGLAQGGRVMYAEGTDDAPVPYGMDKADKPDKSAIDKLIDMKHAESMDAQSQAQPQVPASPRLSPGMPGAENMPQQAAPDAQATQATPDQQADQGQPQTQAAPQAMPPGQARPQMQARQANPNVIPQASMAMTPQQELTHELSTEDQAWAHDLNNGHITPKTYNSLMYYNQDGSDKSTLGKIGSIFGVLMAGAGSGLAHQPNIAMQMMDTVIKNDLEAQKTSKQNAQNYLRLNQERLLNEANIGSVKATTRLTQAQRDQIAYGLSYMQAGRVAVQSQLDELKSGAYGTPDSPSYQQAAQTAMLMAGAVDKNNAAQAMTLGATHGAGMGMYGMNQGQQAQSDPEQKFQNDMQARENMGDKAAADSLRARHIRGVPGFANKPDGVLDTQRMLQNSDILNNKLQDVMDFAEQNKGSVNPQILRLGAQKAHELQAFYNKSVDNLGMTPGRLEWLDAQIKKNPTSIFQQILGNQKVLQEIKDSNLKRTNTQLHDQGFDVKSDSNIHYAQQAQALNWAKANPNDPRSAAILNKLGK